MNNPHESQAAAMARTGELTDGEQLRECINSGQVSAAQVVAHAEAGELPRLPEPNLFAPGTYPHGVLAYTWYQMQDYASAALAAERAEVARLREALQNLLGGVGMCLTSRGERIIDCPVGVEARQVLYPDANIKYTAPGENHD